MDIPLFLDVFQSAILSDNLKFQTQKVVFLLGAEDKRKLVDTQYE
jgi:hypothetical protein